MVNLTAVGFLFLSLAAPPSELVRARDRQDMPALQALVGEAGGRGRQVAKRCRRTVPAGAGGLLPRRGRPGTGRQGSGSESGGGGHCGRRTRGRFAGECRRAPSHSRHAVRPGGSSRRDACGQVRPVRIGVDSQGHRTGPQVVHGLYRTGRRQLLPSGGLRGWCRTGHSGFSEGRATGPEVAGSLSMARHCQPQSWAKRGGSGRAPEGGGSRPRTGLGEEAA